MQMQVCVVLVLGFPLAMHHITSHWSRFSVILAAARQHDSLMIGVCKLYSAALGTYNPTLTRRSTDFDQPRLRPSSRGRVDVLVDTTQ